MRSAMKRLWFSLPFACLAIGAATATATATAQDAVKISPAINTVLLDNTQVRVVRSTFPPGAREGVHTHPAGWYIVTKPGHLRITTAKGVVSEWTPKTDEQGWQDGEAPHTAENVGKGVFEYLYVEVKAAPTKF